ncbi:MAG: hypothetical protein ABSF48_24170, partial [Thermodesulfobacteriota bacterium]
KDVVYRWVKAYQERGEAGLRNQVRSSESRRKLPGPVREKMQPVTVPGVEGNRQLFGTVLQRVRLATQLIASE